MIVDQDECRGPQLEGAFDHLARVDWSMIDRPFLLAFILDQYVFSIEEKYMEFFDFAVTELRIAIVDQLVP